MSTDFPPDRQVLDWLLDPADPAVRARALSDLLDCPADDPDLAAARAGLMAAPPVAPILAAIEPGGHWGPAKSYYTGKYSATVWTLLVLAELGADPADPRIQAACDFILDAAQHRDSGGFSTTPGKAGGRASAVIPCLTGNMLWALLRFGRRDDPRVQAGLGWITRTQRFDDGDGPAPGGWPYDGWEICWGRHSCHMGVVKSLKALAEIPAPARSSEIRASIEAAVEFLLIHHVFKRSHNLARVSKPGWKKFGFPLMYQTDALEILNLLLDLGTDDSRLAEAVDLVREKRGADGRWRLENCYSTLVPIERKGDPSKWITLHALRALKRAGSLRRLGAAA